MKYIDADRLRAFKEALADTIVSAQGLPTYEDCKERAETETDVLLATLFPLQQEQPELNLEKEISRWMVEECGPSDFNPFADHWCVDDIIATARHFAEWQKVQDQKTIELAEDHAMLAGMNKMEQQMMEKAYDTVMQLDELDDLVPTFEDMQKFGFKEGDKVKVIILKEK